MDQSTGNIFRTFSPKRIIWAILIGLGVTLYMIISQFNKEAFLSIQWTWHSSFWIGMALIMTGIREISYMYRIKILTDNKLTWRKSFDVIMLWEFASALTPSVVGGSAVAIFILNKERINTGKSIMIVLVSSFLDELFFILMVPLIILVIGKTNLFSTIGHTNIEGFTQGKGLFYFFWLGYFIILIYIIIVSFALFLNPRGVKWFLLRIFSLPLLRKWKYQMMKTGNDMIIASKEIKKRPFSFWIKSFGATLLSWTARYWVVNCLIMAFTAVSFSNNLIIYARQLIMWVIMLVSPTPGSSGVAELVFSNFLRDFIPIGLVPSLALLWRIVTYYLYLVIGSILLPRWIKQVFSK